MPAPNKGPTMAIRVYHPADERAVIDLWRECGLVVPQNDPRRDIERKVRVQAELFLVGVVAGSIVATCMAGYEGHRGWINYLAVAPAHRRRGYGRLMVEGAAARLHALGCPKINLQVRQTNAAVIAFYRAIGFAVDDVVSLGKRLVADDQAP
jgi:ribosomal protein S18 acetylase RimI-like enzyme